MAEIDGVGGAQQAAPVEPPKEAPKPEVTNTPAAQAPANNDGADSKVGELNFQANQNKFNVAAQEAATGAAAAAKPDPFDAEATVTRVGDKVIIDAGKGDDTIGVTQDAKTGDVTVDVNGKTRTFSGKDKDNLTIKAGDGNDTIKVDRNVTVKLTLEGNDGDDKITGGSGDDTIDGGKGRDYIDGGPGKDKITGGDGDDVIYGGDGDDDIDGGAGHDYIDGGKGNDTLKGGAGNDVISGGQGDDTINGGDGDDVIYAGSGKDTLNGDKGKNTIYAQKDDTTQANDAKNNINNTVITVELKGNPGGTAVTVTGSQEFKDRVEADLETLRSSPLGREMLTAFDDSKKTVTIQETTGGNAADWANRNKPLPQPFIDATTRAKGTPNDATIDYNLTRVSLGGGGWQDRPPLVALYHEMAHAYDFVSGTLEPGTYNGADNPATPDSERTAVGLPIDHDNDPKTANVLSPLHPKNLTENELRKEMGLVTRPQY